MIQDLVTDNTFTLLGYIRKYSQNFPVFVSSAALTLQHLSHLARFEILTAGNMKTVIFSFFTINFVCHMHIHKNTGKM
jgi:hypothetical protein